MSLINALLMGVVTPKYAGNGSPVISVTAGTGYAGSVYTASSFGQWYSNGAPISGETGATFTMTTDYEGTIITNVNGFGTSNAIHLFIPSDLGATVTHFFDALHEASFTKNGAGLVDDWTDRINGYTVSQSTGADKPTWSLTARNSLPGVTFDGVSEKLIIDSVAALPTGSAASTVIQCGYAAAGTGLMGLFSWGTLANNSRRAFGRSSADVLTSFFYGGPYDRESSGSWSDGTDNIVVEKLASGSGAVIDWRAGGASIGSNTTNGSLTTGTDGGYLGAIYDGTISHWNGVVQAVLVADTALATSDIQKIEGFFAHRFGLLSILDAGHPYKTVPPTA